MPKKILKNACIECGGDITVEWTDRMSKEFALVCDVCPDCYSRPTPRVADCEQVPQPTPDNQSTIDRQMKVNSRLPAKRRTLT